MANSYTFCKITFYLSTGLFFALFSSLSYAADIQFITIEKVLKNNGVQSLYPYVVNLASYPNKTDQGSLSKFKKIDADLIYLSKVKVNNKLYYRLVAGNFKTKKSAQLALKKYKKTFANSWVNKRIEKETNRLKEKIAPTIRPIPPLKKKVSIAKKKRRSLNNSLFAEQLLKKMAPYFLDQNYKKIIITANKIIEIGQPKQQQQAMEYLGLARERQGQFAHAISIYTEFLSLYPNSSLTNQIKLRLDGLKTMRIAPKKRLAKRTRRPLDDQWNSFGSISMYYRKGILYDELDGDQELNSSLISNINLIARQKKLKSSSNIRFNGSIINDFLDDDSRTKISRAMYQYHDKEAQYKLSSGRQSRTAKGALGRFDGVVYTDYIQSKFNYSAYAGFPVQSSYDGINTEQRFIGGSIYHEPFKNISSNYYFIHQTVSGLTDRQSVGADVQTINDKGFFYGSFDYDIFYHNLNTFSVISNYRYNDQWSFNINFDYRNSPLISTLNAIQGQTVTTIEELKLTYTDDEIFSLAEDRSSKSKSLFLGSSYKLSDTRQLYFNMSLSTIDATQSSGSVIASPASNYLYLSSHYTIKNYLNLDDYSTIGGRFSQSDTSDSVSVYVRTRFLDKHRIRYQPRFNIDYRDNKNSGLSQWILKPSLKMRYQWNKKLSFEGDFSLEFSDFILPEQDKQSSFDLFIGFVYQM